MNRKLDMTEGVIWKLLVRFFLPILFGSLFQQLYNTADAVIVGNFVGKEALAAVGGTTGTFINLLIGFFGGLASGATVIIAQYYGAKEQDALRRALHTAPESSAPDGERNRRYAKGYSRKFHREFPPGCFFRLHLSPPRQE